VALDRGPEAGSFRGSTAGAWRVDRRQLGADGLGQLAFT
jgi:hypothetical protein